MGLIARTALAVACPLLHAGLIDAECRFNEHAFINTAIRERAAIAATYPASRPEVVEELTLLQNVKAELYEAFATVTTPRK